MSDLSIQKERPAYIEFEKRAVEDRNATIESGRYTAKDAVFVLITPAGTKDRIERDAEEWLAQMRFQAQQSRLPMEFLTYYERAYEAWKRQEEVPLSGTPINRCSLFSPAQVESLKQANVKTLEDLANANEEIIARIGMGGRNLKTQAENWLKSSQDIGVTTAQLSALQIANAELKTKNEALEAKVAALTASVEGLTNSKPQAATSKPL